MLFAAPRAFEVGDQELIQELLNELDRSERELSELEVRKMLSGELDRKNCLFKHQCRSGRHGSVRLGCSCYRGCISDGQPSMDGK